jgi:hypothetical protein
VLHAHSNDVRHTAEMEMVRAAHGHCSARPQWRAFTVAATEDH